MVRSASKPDLLETLSAAQAFEDEILAAFCRETGMRPEIARPFIRPIAAYLMSEYGGSELYVPALTASVQKDEIGRAFASTGDVDFVCKKFGISRATLYRMLGKGSS